MSNLRILRLPFQFQEYRKKKEFIDCNYMINQQSFDAHKIILARSSKLYLKFFSNSDKSTVPIPFGDDAFNFMIDFFYTGSIELPKDSSKDLILYLAMSIIYEVDTLYEIIMPVIESFLNSPTGILQIFDLTRQFKDLKLNSDVDKDFPEINNNFEKLLEKQKIFVPFIVQHFTELTKNGMNKFFKSVTPYLLSEVLKEMHFSNEMNAQIVDKCVDTISEITEKEKEYLQSIINWNDDDAYLLFLNNKMDWVTPDISRSHFERILNARSVSSQSFLELCKNMCLSNNIGNKVNNWWTIQQTQFIRNSKEELPSEFEVTHFIGTIGNENDSYYNPILFKLIDSNCSQNLSEDPEFFGIDKILDDDPETYYVSNPNEEEVNPYIQVSFLKSTFNVTKVEIESVPDRSSPKTLQFLFNDNVIGTAQMTNNLAVLNSNKPIEVNKITVKMVDPVSLPFRVGSLRIYGDFGMKAI